jgi:c-di-GMP-binding flagellar brake protein YcgR
MTTPERRRDPRIPVSHLVKLKCEQTAGKYIPGSTHDVSDGGAMLVLDHPRLLTTGQKVQIGIAKDPTRGMLASEDFVEATIVRSLGHGETQHVAVRYARPQRFAEAI